MRRQVIPLGHGIDPDAHAHLREGGIHDRVVVRTVGFVFLPQEEIERRADGRDELVRAIVLGTRVRPPPDVLREGFAADVLERHVEVAKPLLDRFVIVIRRLPRALVVDRAALYRKVRPIGRRALERGIRRIRRQIERRAVVVVPTEPRGPDALHIDVRGGFLHVDRHARVVRRREGGRGEKQERGREDGSEVQGHCVQSSDRIHDRTAKARDAQHVRESGLLRCF